MSHKYFTQPATVAEEQQLKGLHAELERVSQQQRLTDIVYRIVDSPVGRLLLAATDQGLVRVAFDAEEHDRILQQLAQKIGPRILRSPVPLDTVARQLDEYFSGSRQHFELPLDLRLSTEFRRLVQMELGQIDYGHTLSYREVAERVGRPGAVRAVGTACATNPLPIVLPCHRVVRTDGSLGGYLGGLQAKRTLLDLEGSGAAEPGRTLF